MNKNSEKPPLAGAIWRLNEKSPLVGRYVLLVCRNFWGEFGGEESEKKLYDDSFFVALGVDHYDETDKPFDYVGPDRFDDPEVRSTWVRAFVDEPLPIRSFLMLAMNPVHASHLKDRVGVVRGPVLDALQAKLFPAPLPEHLRGVHIPATPHFLEDAASLNALNESYFRHIGVISIQANTTS